MPSHPILLTLAFMLMSMIAFQSAPIGAHETFHAPGLGACGKTNTANQLIVAVGHGIFDSFPGATANPNKNPICGKKLKATFGGKSVTVAVADRCAGCAGAADLDFTEAGFKKLATLDKGRIHGVKWEWV
ncbi:RlpA-like double-psi beta-barrel-protein domain-containing protein-containing protein [Mycena rosella]|uniref:RlpA-like double-psi beta-barrel-protein domain-containing protein-containing protein n=1 Tax=Mycena rosella TaxID=1033263 RepID=A0AAD7D6H5_MYCRO|nr:RlpA-like double-psi beta-barrel-protein domain-containing protein-containing protein [Mycena rosella]